MRLKILFKELQRRHVFKAGVAYLVVAWLIIQVLSILIPAFEVPNHLLQFSIIILLVGFPIWLVISWFYDFTEDGIVLTKKIEYDSETISKKNVNLNKVIITALSIIVVMLIVNTFRMKADLTANSTMKASMIPEFKSSVAVLAFADMSPEHNKEYFADGMSEEILNKLARCKGLKVIGRTSSFAYKDKDVTLDIIGRELDVAYILEGSVRQSGDIFRITVQLIDVSDGSHIWSDTFDRKMADALIVQEEIASIVAERLEVSLLSEDPNRRRVDPKAYELYLQAHQALINFREDSLIKADSLIHESLEMDDTYAPSWNVLANILLSKTYDFFLVDQKAGHEAGVFAAKKAIELEPTNAMGYVWLASFAWQSKQVDLSADYMETALQLAPNNPKILEQAGNWAMRTNRLEEAERFYDKTLILNPKSWISLKYKAFLRWTARDLDTAEELIIGAYDNGLPDYFRNYEMALLQRDMGNLEAAKLCMEKEQDEYLYMLLDCSLSYAMGNHVRALEVLNLLKKYPTDANRTEFLYSDAEHNFELAILYAYMDDKTNAFKYLDLAFEHILIWTEWLFTTPDLTPLHTDPRWDELLEKLGREYDFDFANRV